MHDLEFLILLPEHPILGIPNMGHHVHFMLSGDGTQGFMNARQALYQVSYNLNLN